MPRQDRPSRHDGRLITMLLRGCRCDPDDWDGDERAAVTRLHLWAHGAEPNLDNYDALSDGYLDDAEGFTPADPTPPEVLALMRIDRVLGNEGALSAKGVGRVRGLVLDALRHWHATRGAKPTAQPHGLPPIPLGAALPDGTTLDDLRAESAAEPQVRVIDSTVAGWVLTPEVLDGLTVLARDGARAYTPLAGSPDGETSAAAQVDRLARFIMSGVPGEPSRGDEGAVDCALRLLGEHVDGCAAQADALRAEVARLSGLLGDAAAEADRADRAEADLARARADWEQRSAEGREQVRRLVEHGDTLRRQLNEANRHTAEARDERDAARRAVEANLRDLATRTDERDEARRQVADLGRELDACRAQQGRQAATIAEQRMRHLAGLPVELHVNGAGLVTFDGRELRIDYDTPVGGTIGAGTIGAAATPQPARRPTPLDRDPRRPQADHYDEVGVTLSWRELRMLVALHLDHAHESPATCAALARAMRDDGAPLRLAEVLDR